jgi:LmbE family N-acetylglucosaminyl deacetylase
VVVLVAHPDDETLWAGGTLLMKRAWAPFVLGACRKSDSDRAPKFFRVLSQLGAQGTLADLDDGPLQSPLADSTLERTLLESLPSTRFDRIVTHSPLGEYTRHRRHEEVACAALRLWSRGQLQARELWLFAYEDGNRAYLPHAIADADIVNELPFAVWQQKLALVTVGYGFDPESWEARACPRREAFFRLRSPLEAAAWLEKKRDS